MEFGDFVTIFSSVSPSSSDQAASRVIDLINTRHNLSLELLVEEKCLLVSPDPRDLIYCAVGIGSNTKRLLGRENSSLSRENLDEG